MKVRRLEKREEIILCLTVAIAVLGLVVNFLIIPAIARIREVNQQIENKIALFKRYNRLIKKGSQILSSYQEYRETLEAESTIEESETNLFQQVKESAQTSGMIIESVKPLSHQIKEGYKEVLLEVESRGSFSSLFQFINHLEYSPLFIRVSSLQVFPEVSESRQLRCRIILAKLLI